VQQDPVLVPARKQLAGGQHGQGVRQRDPIVEDCPCMAHQFVHVHAHRTAERDGGVCGLDQPRVLLLDAPQRGPKIAMRVLFMAFRP